MTVVLFFVEYVIYRVELQCKTHAELLTCTCTVYTVGVVLSVSFSSVE